jgi:hypothetical protein
MVQTVVLVVEQEIDKQILVAQEIHLIHRHHKETTVALFLVLRNQTVAVEVVALLLLVEAVAEILLLEVAMAATEQRLLFQEHQLPMLAVVEVVAELLEAQQVLAALEAVEMEVLAVQPLLQALLIRVAVEVEVDLLTRLTAQAELAALASSSSSTK